MAHLFGPVGSSRTEELLDRILKRSHLEVKMDLLEAVQMGASNRALLLSRMKLPWSILRENVGSLVEAGFLEVEDKDGWMMYRLKPKGLQVIKRYRAVVGRVETTMILER
jgi:predicted transcriptional regulator